MPEEKTNVMRQLDQKKIPYTPHQYPHAGGAAPDGRTVAALTGLPAERVFKTLVTTGASGQHYVFVVPVEGELNLKAAAKAAGEKSIAMLRQADLLPLTGYIHGGCSPIGMKKRFPTILDASAQALQTIAVSAGKVGYQVELSPSDLADLIGAKFAPIAQG